MGMLGLVFHVTLVLACLFAWSGHPRLRVNAQALAQAATPTPGPLAPGQLIDLVNHARSDRGLRTLVVDPILMTTAQDAANIMAASHMAGRLGDVTGRVAAAGYGAGDTPWATENFLVMPVGTDPLIILDAWSDAVHMKPMTDPNYRHVGAGVSVTPQGQVYYILQAAYTSHGIYQPGQPVNPTGGTAVFIYPVDTVTPQPDGSLIHTVQYGQSLWSIAIAYQTHIDAIQRLNGIPVENLTIYEGQRLRIPTPSDAPVPRLPTAVLAEQATAAPVELEPSATIQTDLPVEIPNTGPSPEQMISTGLIVLTILGGALVAFGMLARK